MGRLLTLHAYRDLLPVGERSPWEFDPEWRDLTLEGSNLSPLDPGDHNYLPGLLESGMELGSDEEIRLWFEFLSQRLAGVDLEQLDEFGPDGTRRPFYDLLALDGWSGFLGPYACRRLMAEFLHFEDRHKELVDREIRQPEYRARFNRYYETFASLLGDVAEKGSRLGVLRLYWANIE